jgi:hypothetical protein
MRTGGSVRFFATLLAFALLGALLAVPGVAFAVGDTFATAVDIPTLPATVTGTLNSPLVNAQDIYKIHVPRGQRFKSTATPLTAGLNSWMLVFYPTPSDPFVWSDSRWRQTFSWPYASEVSVFSRTDDPYYIAVYQGFSTGGDYSLSVSASPGPADSEVGAGCPQYTVPFVVDDAVSANMDPINIIRVYLAAGQVFTPRLAVDPGTIPSYVDMDLNLYAPTATSRWSDTPVATSANHETTIESFTYTAPTAGWYYLEVFMPEDGVSGNYTLTAGAPTITIKSDLYSVRLPKPFVLTGVLMPGLYRDPCVVEVRKPNRARWSYSSARLAVSATAGGGANWWYRYKPLLRGTYSFRVRYTGIAPRGSCVSRIISVRVR